MQKECVCCCEIKDSREFRKWRRQCKMCERALKAPWQGQTAYMRQYMARRREEDPKYGRNSFKELQAALKQLGKRPNYLLSKHPLAISSDAHPAFRDPLDPGPDPCEALMLREEAA